MNQHDAVTVLSTVTGWRKSTVSADADCDCLEVTTVVSGWIGVRDSKLAARSPVLAFTMIEWTAFTAAVRIGEFD